METAEQTAPEAVENTQPEGVETQTQEVSQPTGGENKSVDIKALVKKGEDDPNYQYSDKELDLLEKTDFGTKPLTPPSEPKEETQEEDEYSEDESQKDSEDEKPKVDPEIEEAMKEVGAKDPKELAGKIKELRKALSGKDSQAVSKLSKEVESLRSLQQNEERLWDDYKKGIPEAVNMMKQRGIVGQNVEQESKQKPDGNLFIDKDKFIDPESAELVNNVIGSLKAEIDSLKNSVGEVQSERQRYINENASQKARNSVIDEMVKISQKMDGLGNVPNLREHLSDYLDGKGDNDKLEVFKELFDIAEESNTNLENAFLIKRGRDADTLILKAKQDGVKEAYKPKPNPSLSDVQAGEEGGRSVTKPLTEQEINAMEDDYRLMPPSWFDRDGEPIKSKVPKGAWRLFW